MASAKKNNALNMHDPILFNHNNKIWLSLTLKFWVISLFVSVYLFIKKTTNRNLEIIVNVENVPVESALQAFRKLPWFLITDIKNNKVILTVTFCD